MAVTKRMRFVVLERDEKNPKDFNEILEAHTRFKAKKAALTDARI